jgi:hypothetical protein
MRGGWGKFKYKMGRQLVKLSHSEVPQPLGVNLQVLFTFNQELPPILDQIQLNCSALKVGLHTALITPKLLQGQRSGY